MTTPFEAQIQALKQLIAQRKEGMPSQQEYYDAVAAQHAAKNKANMSQAYMQGGRRDPNTWYDVISEAFRNYHGAKQFKDAETSWVDAGKKASQYEQGQKLLEKDQERLQKMQDEEIKRKQALEYKKAYALWEKENGIKRGTTVNVNPNGVSSHLMNKLDENDAKLYDEWKRGAHASTVILGKISDLENLQKMVETGAWEEAKGILGKYIPVGGLKDAASIQQAYTGVLNNIIPDIKSTFGSLGVMSKDDWKIILDTLPQFANNKDANQLIMAMLKKGAARAQDRYNSATQYIRDNKTLFGYQPDIYFNPQNQEAINKMMQTISGMSDDDLVNSL